MAFPLTNDSGDTKNDKHSNSIDIAVRNCQKLSPYCIKNGTPAEFNQNDINNGGKKCRPIIPIKNSIIKKGISLAQCRKRKIAISNDTALENRRKRSKLVARTAVNSYANRKDTGKSRQLGNIKLKIQKPKSLFGKYNRIRERNDSVKMTHTKGEYVGKLLKRLGRHSVEESLKPSE